MADGLARLFTRAADLSATQARILSATLRLEDAEGACGYIPEGAGEWSSIRALIRRGLMVFAGFGACIDDSRTPPLGDPDGFQIFALTAAGRELAEEVTVADPTWSVEGTARRLCWCHACQDPEMEFLDLVHLGPVAAGIRAGLARAAAICGERAQEYKRVMEFDRAYGAQDCQWAINDEAKPDRRDEAAK